MVLSQLVLSNNAVIPISQLSKLRLREGIACLRLPCKTGAAQATAVGKALGRGGTELKGRAAKIGTLNENLVVV